ncbi:ATP-binding protein [Amycolatopsis mongoliensis]|uniref:ATP-binding protein n=1 Tax=Amycolatopsis mongoliensis TaxID=715475 RepID=A0A9Y2JZ05_9PSEU|nr:ATP-binding protein [Amycolatopsis sp. 4-36]WIY05569.1 ATP-binding protein [Amycolatopsis sp. 4-36]
MEARTRVITLDGSQARIVDIRANFGVGDTGLRVHGLNPVSRETRDRVRAAIRNSSLSWPEGVVHLTASTTHPRSDVDLAAATAALLVTKAVPARRLTATALIGELGLDGTVRPLPDVRTRAIAAAEGGFTHLVVPAANAAEAGLVPGLTIVPVACLDELVSWLRGGPTPAPRPESGDGASPTTSWAPEAWARLTPTAVRAAAVAAAGGHHTLHVAAPGTPVLLLPRLIRALMADLTDTEALEVSTWHFLADEPAPDRSEHHRPPGVPLLPDDTIAAVAGSLSRPGLLTLAHRGVLTVEDLPGLSTRIVEVLRPALENGVIGITAAAGAEARPAGARMVFTARDCLCGSVRTKNCRCTPAQRARYLARIPQWLLDRVDLFLREVTVAEPDPSLPSLESLRDSVARARERARYRWGAAPEPGAEIDYTKAVAGLPANAVGELDDAIRQGRITPRTAARCLRLAWTRADLDGRAHPDIADIWLTLSHRSGMLGLLRNPAPR